MYESKSSQISFILPFEGNLNSDNRWVKLSNLLPWDEIEEKYAKSFPAKKGAPAKSARMALAALIIKEMLRLSDEATVEIIAETPAMQYFLGLERFIQKVPFDPSLMVHFRKRFGADFIEEINQLVIRQGQAGGKDNNEEPPDGIGGSDKLQSEKRTKQDLHSQTHHGKLIIDATCAPADIHYPTDLGILNKAREKSEEIIDVLYGHSTKENKKPRTYRRTARKQYLNLARSKKPGLKAIRKGNAKQLRYLKRNLGHIARLAETVSLCVLSRTQYKNLLVIHEVFRQQQILHETKSRSISDRIVSVSQPHVRPIVRGKMKASTEFGAKISASVCSDGFVTLDRLSWDAYNESGDLMNQVEKYRERTGYYPQAVLADKIYRTRENRRLCKEKGIRLSGPNLGRPSKSEEIRKDQILQNQQDERERNAIEGKFGQAKRRFGLSRIMAKLKQSSESMIAISFLVMNLERLRAFLFFLFFGFCRCINSQPEFFWLFKSEKIRRFQLRFFCKKNLESLIYLNS